MRRMRILSFPDRTVSPEAVGYTLVMEWFDDNGRVTKDKRYTMYAEEFDLFKLSVNQANTSNERDIWQERSNEA